MVEKFILVRSEEKFLGRHENKNFLQIGVLTRRVREVTNGSPKQGVSKGRGEGVG